MCCSVTWWSRASSERRVRRRRRRTRCRRGAARPAAAAASTNARCSSSRSSDSAAETISTTSRPVQRPSYGVPVGVRRLRRPSCRGSSGARAGSRTTSRCSTPAGGEQPGDPAAEVAGGTGDAEHHGVSRPSRSRRPAPPGGRAGRARSRAPRGRRGGRTAPARRSPPIGAPGDQRALGGLAPSRAGSSSRSGALRGEPVGVAGGRLGRGRRAVQHLDVVALAAQPHAPVGAEGDRQQVDDLVAGGGGVLGERLDGLEVEEQVAPGAVPGDPEHLDAVELVAGGDQRVGHHARARSRAARRRPRCRRGGARRSRWPRCRRRPHRSRPRRAPREPGTSGSSTRRRYGTVRPSRTWAPTSTRPGDVTTASTPKTTSPAC